MQSVRTRLYASRAGSRYAGRPDVSPVWRTNRSVASYGTRLVS